MEHLNLAALFEPGCLLRLGLGLAVQLVNIGHPAMVQQGVAVWQLALQPPALARED